MAGATLPLFPLGTLLVPGQVMPLRLFEGRYLALHRDLMARPEQERSVGVVLILEGSEVGVDRTGTLATVGCEGVLLAHEEATVAGRPIVLWQLQGARRFRLERHDVAPEGFLEGEVSWLDVEPDETGMLVHQRCAEAGLGVRDRQRVLEAPDAATRDALAERLIRRESWLREQFGGRPVHQLPSNESLN